MPRAIPKRCPERYPKPWFTSGHQIIYYYYYYYYYYYHHDYHYHYLKLQHKSKYMLM